MKKSQILVFFNPLKSWRRSIPSQEWALPHRNNSSLVSSRYITAACLPLWETAGTGNNFDHSGNVVFEKLTNMDWGEIIFYQIKTWSWGNDYTIFPFVMKFDVRSPGVWVELDNVNWKREKMSYTAAWITPANTIIAWYSGVFTQRCRNLKCWQSE